MPIQTTNLQLLKENIKAAFVTQKEDILKVATAKDLDEDAITTALAEQIAVAIDNHIKRIIVTIKPGIVLTGAGSITPSGAVTITGTTTGTGTS
jgi:hypothetical protein